MSRELTYPPAFLVDGRQSVSALSVQRGVCRYLRRAGLATVTELSLTTGRRADVVGLDPRGTIWIIEIKSGPEDFRADRKWPEYMAFCDRFYFAIPPGMDSRILPADTGLIVADGYGAEILRASSESRLPASRRKAVLLRFAHTAALRLHNIGDPYTET